MSEIKLTLPGQWRHYKEFISTLRGENEKRVDLEKYSYLCKQSTMDKNAEEISGYFPHLVHHGEATITKSDDPNVMFFTMDKDGQKISHPFILIEKASHSEAVDSFKSYNMLRKKSLHFRYCYCIGERDKKFLVFYEHPSYPETDETDEKVLLQLSICCMIGQETFRNNMVDIRKYTILKLDHPIQIGYTIREKRFYIVTDKLVSLLPSSKLDYKDRSKQDEELIEIHNTNFSNMPDKNKYMLQGRSFKESLMDLLTKLNMDKRDNSKEIIEYCDRGDIVKYSEQFYTIKGK